MISYLLGVVVLGLSVLLPYLTYEGVNEYVELQRLKQQQFEYRRALETIEQRKQELARAQSFMEKAVDFVEKARQLGIRDGKVNSYKIDFSQQVDITKIPLLLEQSRSVSGRYYVPKSLTIAREGIVTTEKLPSRLSSAITQRHRDYNLAFKGDVFVVDHEG